MSLEQESKGAPDPSRQTPHARKGSKRVGPLGLLLAVLVFVAVLIWLFS